MNIARELNIINEWKKHVKELRTTDTKHYFILMDVIIGWNRRIKEKENNILVYLKLKK